MSFEKPLLHYPWLALTWLSRPKIINMKKKHIDQKGPPGIRATASGYAMNANPNPTTKMTNKELQNIYE